MYDIYIYIYILKSLQTCQQSHKAKHGDGGRWPQLQKGVATLLQLAANPSPERGRGIRQARTR